MKVIDQMGREANIPQPPQRIVSLVPSQTELLFDLGLEEKIVGLTKFCIHPKVLHKQKTHIGGTKKFNFEAIDELRPDLIIGNKEENYKEGIEMLEQKYPVWMSDIYQLPDALQMIEEVGKITGSLETAQFIVQEIKTEFSKLHSTKKTRTLYLIWKKPYMAAGKNNFIDEMLTYCGWENVVTENRYPSLSEEDMLNLSPELVLLSSEPYPFKEKHIKDIQTLLPQAKIMLVDGELFSWYGSRLRNAPRYFRAYS